jgi:CspA family cold shock protein
MATPSVSNSTVTQSTDRFTGRVKWFNNKAGYGFITVTDGPKSGTDIFVHHSSINVSTQQYKYLVQGEYIEFTLSNVSSGDHEFQAVDVSGIKGGQLMCETRHELRTVRTNYKDQTQPLQVKEEVKVEDTFKEVQKANRKPRQQSAPAEGGRGSGGRTSGAGRGRGRVVGRGSGRGSGGRT